MRLAELFPDPNDFFDPLDMSDIENYQGINADAAKTEKKPPFKSPGRASNVAKATRIRNLARMKSRDADPGRKEAPYEYNLGGHFTSWLDRGGHG